jgi:Domain of unknown function (DUF4383)
VSEPNVLQGPVEKTPHTSVERSHTGVGPWLRSRTLAQSFCLLIGAFLLVRASSTLAAGASFALPGDGWRATFQMAIAALLLFSSGSRKAAYRAVIAVGATYALVSILGIANGHDVLGVIPLDTRDKIVHPVLALLAVIVSILGPTRSPRLRRT